MTDGPAIAALRAEAEALASPLPALLAEAQALAATVILGEHGRRRTGMGEDFWQYRQAQPGDPARAIDWRRSARGDTAFVQDKEWQIAQSVMIWVDGGASMDFASEATLPAKGARARLLALATAVLLLRGGERVGLLGTDLGPGRGRAQIDRVAARLSRSGDGADYGAPATDGLMPHSRALLISDFLGDLGPTEAALQGAADRGVRGALVQVLDPQEESFPFAGRTIFESMAGSLMHETLKAGDLRGRYLARLAERKDRLRALALAAGWRHEVHLTSRPAATALLWLYGALGRG